MRPSASHRSKRTRTSRTQFVIEPDGPFSLAAAAGFGFGPNTGRPKPEGGLMRLAFALDGYAGHAGAVLRQAEPDGPIAVDAEADGDRAIVEHQIRRILSLDHPGRDWMAVGMRDPVDHQRPQAACVRRVGTDEARRSSREGLRARR